uniref:Glycosyltransferase n=1 Tax=Solanum tuberosum TaxID=4113 RepID=M1D2X4_SOLTU
MLGYPLKASITSAENCNKANFLVLSRLPFLQELKGKMLGSDISRARDVVKLEFLAGC